MNDTTLIHPMASTERTVEPQPFPTKPQQTLKNSPTPAPREANAPAQERGDIEYASWLRLLGAPRH